jgi:hypothetical protein
MTHVSPHSHIPSRSRFPRVSRILLCITYTLIHIFQAIIVTWSSVILSCLPRSRLLRGNAGSQALDVDGCVLVRHIFAESFLDVRVNSDVIVWGDRLLHGYTKADFGRCRGAAMGWCVVRRVGSWDLGQGCSGSVQARCASMVLCDQTGCIITAVVHGR